VMKTIASLLLSALAVSAFTEQEYQQQFTSWMRKNGKSFAHDEFSGRYAVFKQNLDFITAHNADPSQSFTVALNEFAHYSSEEFGQMYRGLRVPENYNRNGEPQVVSGEAIPNSVNWVAKGAVTPIKNQGQCGSCWSFSTTGSVEGCHFLTTGRLVALSEQNLIDCSVAQGNNGCNGGLMDDAFQYIITNNGIDTEASYPYTTSGPNQCEYSAANCGSRVTSFTDVTSGSEAALAEAVAMKPVSVAIDASQSSFQFYSTGVYYEPACSSTQLDHGVLAAGYGVDAGKDYWLVKNSWGTSWGQNGYIWMSRNRQNNCGIATAASYPSGCKNCA